MLNPFRKTTLDNFSIKQFHKDGFLILRNAFSKDEVQEIREAGLATRNLKGDLLANSRLRHVVLEDRILKLVHALLGDTPTYFGDGILRVGGGNICLHKDNTDRFDKNAPDWQSDYPLLRVGLYAQDYTKHSGGLVLRKGSHNIADVNSGRAIYVNTGIGDIAVWNLRMTHTGHGRRLRGLGLPVLHPYLLDKLPLFCYSPQGAERVFLMITYGLKGAHYERHIEYLKTRADSVEVWRNSPYDDAVWKAAKGKDIIIEDMEKQIRNLTDIGKNPFYAPIAYAGHEAA